jgi:hypothetical protein
MGALWGCDDPTEFRQYPHIYSKDDTGKNIRKRGRNFIL